MVPISSLGFLLGGAASAGLNLYLTILLLGLSHQFEIFSLPDKLLFIAHPIVLIAMFIMVVIEFFADKIPYVDSVWDLLHTFLRPMGAAVLGYSIAPDDALTEAIMATVAGGVGLTTHSAKAGTRVVANHSPEPLSNTLLSFLEDGIVLAMVYFIVNHPYVAVVAAILILAVAFILIYFAWRIAGGIFKWIFGETGKADTQG